MAIVGLPRKEIGGAYCLSSQSKITDHVISEDNLVCRLGSFDLIGAVSDDVSTNRHGKKLRMETSCRSCGRSLGKLNTFGRCDLALLFVRNFQTPNNTGGFFSRSVNLEHNKARNSSGNLVHFLNRVRSIRSILSELYLEEV
ncbi:hypothetical protein U1Q18_018328 [Sarracenia purpurea var. burkii]